MSGISPAALAQIGGPTRKTTHRCRGLNAWYIQFSRSAPRTLAAFVGRAKNKLHFLGSLNLWTSFSSLYSGRISLNTTDDARNRTPPRTGIFGQIVPALDYMVKPTFSFYFLLSIIIKNGWTDRQKK
jgi:hypothetical protein